ncbi:MAG: glucose 1-dehydrogenase [Myxococcota bacterium]
MSKLFSLEGKVAIITGASRGIGEAMAHAYAEHGARVVVAARKPEALEEVARAIQAKGGQVRAVPTHAARRDELEALVKAAVDAFGKVDILVNNAATNVYFGPMMGAEDGAYQKTFDLNVKGYFDLARLVAQHLMDRRAPGAIINVSSVLGLGAAPLQGVYGMTKAAVISMTRTMATELGGAGIRVNAIAPGLIKTRFSQALTDSPDVSGRVLQQTPLGRLGEPADIAGAAVFLGSDASSFVTGHTLVVDGGLTLGGF